jgi:hypothetical protein
MSKRYIGDGCYVDFDGYALVLTTEDGISTTNRIVLEPEVYGALVTFVEDLKARARQQCEPEQDGDESRP